MFKFIRKFKKKKKKNHRNKKNIIGDIHYVPVVHVVSNRQLKKYKSDKGSLNKNRPVAIVKKNSDHTVEIAKITSKVPNNHQIKNGYRSKLSKTKLPKQSWIDTDNISNSFHTGKKFKDGENPLHKKRVSRVSSKDLKTRELIKKRKEKKSSRR